MDEDKTTTNSSDTAMQVDFLVKQMIAELDTLKEQLKEQRQMVKDALETNVQVKDISDQIKNITKKKKEITGAILEQTAVKQAREEVKSLQEQYKSVEKKLSDYLKQYVETYNSRTIEDANGAIKDIVTVYKLVSRSSSTNKY